MKRPTGVMYEYLCQKKRSLFHNRNVAHDCSDYDEYNCENFHCCHNNLTFFLILIYNLTYISLCLLVLAHSNVLLFCYNVHPFSVISKGLVTLDLPLWLTFS